MERLRSKRLSKLNKRPPVKAKCDRRAVRLAGSCVLLPKVTKVCGDKNSAEGRAQEELVQRGG